MNAGRSPDYFIGLVQELRKLPKETEWTEFKVNKAEPVEIGEYLSALSNAAALAGKVVLHHLHVGVHHQFDQVVELRFGFPTQLFFRL